jgi:hypothetical protein
VRRSQTGLQQQLLERYLEIENGRVPAAVFRRRELLLAHADRRLHVRIARTGSLRVLMLDERNTRMEKLTARVARRAEATRYAGT